MGFLDSFGKIAGEAAKSMVNNVVDTAKQQQQYVEYYSDWDDERLIEQLKRESDTKKKMAIGYVLKQRGYGNND